MPVRFVIALLWFVRYCFFICVLLFLSFFVFDLFITFCMSVLLAYVFMCSVCLYVCLLVCLLVFFGIVFSLGLHSIGISCMSICASVRLSVGMCVCMYVSVRIVLILSVRFVVCLIVAFVLCYFHMYVGPVSLAYLSMLFYVLHVLYVCL